MTRGDLSHGIQDSEAFKGIGMSTSDMQETGGVPHGVGDGHFWPLPLPVLPHGGVQRVLALTGIEGFRLLLL